MRYDLTVAATVGAVRAPATYRDIEALAPHLVGELVAGELFVSPRPAIPHAIAHSELGYELIGPFSRGRGGPGGWWIFDEPELHFGADVLVPDLAGWRRPRLPSPPTGAAFTIAPDWVCEVLSPSTASFDRVRKLAVYGRESVRWVWLLDPLARTLEVLRWEGKAWVVAGNYGGDQVIEAEPFEAARIDLLPLWGETRNPPPQP